MNRFFKGIVGAVTLAVVSLGFSTFTNASTGIYVGKDVSKEGTTVIARTSVYAPGTPSCITVVPRQTHEEGDSITSNSGFVYYYPEETYQYQELHGMSKVNGYSVSDAAINEYGLAITGPTTGHISDEAFWSDPYVDEGIGEFEVCKILAATCRSSREAVETLAGLIDTYGAYNGNIYLMADQHEAWYMEVYTGHQYAAVKLPDDMVAVFGDDFSLTEIDLQSDDVIVSPDFINLPEENGYIKYNKGGVINPFETYCGKELLSDQSQMRKWIGQKELATSAAKDYSVNKQYSLLFAPDEPVSVGDVFKLTRNRYEGTKYEGDGVEDYFVTDDYTPIGSQTVVNADVIQVYDNVPAKMANIMWVNFDGPNYSPFMPVSNLVEDVPEAYSRDLTDMKDYEAGLPSYDFHKISAICNRDDEYIGGSVRNYWECVENYYLYDIYNKMRYDWQDLYNESPEMARTEVTTYCADVMGEMHEDSDRVYEEILEYMMHAQTDGSFFEIVPDYCARISDGGLKIGIDLEKYANRLGFDYREDGNDIYTTFDDGIKRHFVYMEDSADYSYWVLEDYDDTATEEATDVIVQEDEQDVEIETEDEVDIEEDDKVDVETEAVEQTEQPDLVENPAGEETVEVETVETDSAMAIGTPIELNLDVNFEIPADVIDKMAEIKQILIDDFNAFIESENASIPKDGISKEDLIAKIEAGKEVALELFENDFSAFAESIPVEIFENDSIRQEAVDLLGKGQETISELVATYYDDAIGKIDENIAIENLTKEQAEDILSGIALDVEGIVEKCIPDSEIGLILEDLDVEEIEEILNEAGNAIVEIVKEYSGIDLTEITEDDIVRVVEQMDPEAKDFLGQLFNVDVDAIINEYKENKAAAVKEAENGAEVEVENSDGSKENDEDITDVAEEAVVEETVAEETVAEETAVEEEVVVEETAAEETAAEETVTEETVAEETVAEETAVEEEVVVEETAAEETAAEEAVAEETTVEEIASEDGIVDLAVEPVSVEESDTTAIEEVGVVEETNVVEESNTVEEPNTVEGPKTAEEPKVVEEASVTDEVIASDNAEVDEKAKENEEQETADEIINNVEDISEDVLAYLNEQYEQAEIGDELSETLEEQKTPEKQETTEETALTDNSLVAASEDEISIADKLYDENSIVNVDPAIVESDCDEVTMNFVYLYKKNGRFYLYVHLKPRY